MDIPPGPHRPTVDVDSESWWAAVQDRRLMVSRCAACGRKWVHPRPFCPHCWGEDIDLSAATGKARVYTWSVIHQNAAPFDSRTPYVVAMVDLDEGPRLMTVLEDCPPERVQAGMDVAIAFRDDDDGFTVPVFRPV